MPIIDSEATNVSSRVRVMQIITLALAFGCATFGAIALLIVLQGNLAPNPAADILVYMAAGFMVLQVALSFAWPLLTVNRALRKVAARQQGASPLPLAPSAALNQGGAAVANDLGTLLPMFQSQLIVRLALIEGAAFFNGIVFLLTGSWLSLGLLVFGAVLILLQFPTVRRVSQWLENRLEDLERTRAQGDFAA